MRTVVFRRSSVNAVVCDMGLNVATKDESKNTHNLLSPVLADSS